MLRLCKLSTNISHLCLVLTRHQRAHAARMDLEVRMAHVALTVLEAHATLVVRVSPRHLRQGPSY